MKIRSLTLILIAVSAVYVHASGLVGLSVGSGRRSMTMEIENVEMKMNYTHADVLNLSVYWDANLPDHAGFHWLLSLGAPVEGELSWGSGVERDVSDLDAALYILSAFGVSFDVFDRRNMVVRVAPGIASTFLLTRWIDQYFVYIPGWGSLSGQTAMGVGGFDSGPYIDINVSLIPIRPFSFIIGANFYAPVVQYATIAFSGIDETYDNSEWRFDDLDSRFYLGLGATF